MFNCKLFLLLPTMQKFSTIAVDWLEDTHGQGWGTGQRTPLPPVWPGLDSDPDPVCGASLLVFHYSASCPKVVNPAKRKEILQRKHRCLICLRVGHRVSECQTTKTCRHCNKRHHQSICDQGAPNQETSITSIAHGKSENSQVSATAALRKRGTVLLQTATAVATNEDGTKMTKARILFDSGSYRSYVTNDLK